MAEATTADIAAREAAALLEVGRWDDASRRLTMALAQHPDHLTALCLLAQCYIDADQPARALQTANLAVAADPNSSDAHRRRAQALLGLHQPRQAIRAADNAVRLAPDNPATHAVMAACLLDVGGTRSIVRARRHSDRALSLAADSPGLHVLDAVVSMRMADLAAARRACARALALEPDNQEALHNLAVLDLLRNRVGGATRGFDDAIALAPDDAQTGYAHALSVRAWLWRRFDVLCLIGLVVIVGAAFVDAALDSIPRPVGLGIVAAALAGYGWYVHRSVAVLSRGALLSLRRQLWRRPTFVAAPLCAAIVTGSMIVMLAVQPPGDSILASVFAGSLMVPGIVFVVRLRNRLLRRIYLYLRRRWFTRWTRSSSQ